MPCTLYLSLYLILNVNRAFKLLVSGVIHTVGPIYDVDKRPEVLLKKAYE
jgi:O-acetyl-ADP-ribose deacetylase